MKNLHPKDSAEFLLPRTVGKRKSRPKAKTPEAEIQDLTEQYLQVLGIPFLHIPAYLLNMGFSSQLNLSGPALYAARHAAESVRGFPDIVAFDRARKSFLPIELKSSIGKLTDNQEMWGRWLGTVVCRSFEEAKAEIDAWRTA